MNSLMNDNRKMLSWAFYDWANSAFSTTVIVGFFPIFFKQYWSADADAVESTFWLGAANSAASVLVAICAPVLGTIADKGSFKKKHLLAFAGMAIVMTGVLPFIAKGNWQIALLIYIMAITGFSGANIFYDALIVDVSPKEKLERVSAIGYSLGYLGGGLLFALNVAMVLSPATFGLADSSEGVKWSFASVAVWWAVFSIPLILFVTEPARPGVVYSAALVKSAFKHLAETFKSIRQHKTVFLFLLAYWLYIDGVYTVNKMAVAYGIDIGLKSDTLISALLLTQFVGFPAAYLFGIIGEKYGPKKGIYPGLAIYTIAVIWGYFMSSSWEFYFLAGAIGIAIGGVQSLSRAFFARLIPSDKGGEFFGFYNALGKLASILGPVLMGSVGLLTGSARLGIMATGLLIIAGGTLLYFVDDNRGKA